MSRSLCLLFITLLITLACAAPITTRDTLEKRGGTKGTFKGTGTWFLPASEGGAMGACGKKEGNKSMIVAMNRPQYGNTSKKSKWCGKKLKVKGPKGSAVVVVNDACPECKKGDLDMTPIVFKKVVGDMNKGVGKITWHAV